MEVPVAYPQLLDPQEPRTYVINDVLGTVRLVEPKQQQQHHQHLSVTSGTNTTVVTTPKATTAAQKQKQAAAVSTPTQSSTSTSTSKTSFRSNHRSYDRGAASSTWMSLSSTSSSFGRSRTVLVTTTPVLTTSTYIIAVTMLHTSSTNYTNNTHTKKNSTHTQTIHLDIGTETRFFQNVAKVQAFATSASASSYEDNEEEEVHSTNVTDGIQVTVIDTNGFVITIVLSGVDLVPTRTKLLHCYSIQTSVLNNNKANNTITTTRSAGRGASSSALFGTLIATYAIRSSMILFLNKSSVLLSLNPFLIAIDLDLQIAIEWSKTLCLEDMRLRKQRMNGIGGSIVESIVGLFTGSSSSSSSNNSTRGSENDGYITTTTEVGFGSSSTKRGAATPVGRKRLGQQSQIHVLDMNPVSALVAADNDPTQIFTLHSDGIVRRWVLERRPQRFSTSATTKTNGSSMMLDGDEDDTNINNNNNIDGEDDVKVEDRVRYLRPYEVYDLQIYPRSNSNIIPSPELWSDDWNSLFMTARMYDHNQLFVLAISIQTTSIGASAGGTIVAPDTSSRSTAFMIPAGGRYNSSINHDVDELSLSATESTEYEIFSSNANMSASGGRNNDSSDCHILVLDGRVDNTDDDGITSVGSSNGGGGGFTSYKKIHCIALKVPSKASALVGMSFDCQQDRCVLQAMFFAGRTTVATPQVRAAVSCDTILVTYPSSNISIVYREPQLVLGNDHSSSRFCSFDGIAHEELERIRNLTFYKYHTASINEDGEDDNDDDINEDHVISTIWGTNHQKKLNEILHSIDCSFLQYLFRPTAPRGVGGLVIPPSPHHIHHAIMLRQRGAFLGLITPIGNTSRFRSSNTSSSSSGSSLELQVVRIMHELRKTEMRRQKQQQQSHFQPTNATATSLANTSMVRFAAMTTPRKGQKVSTTVPGTPYYAPASALFTPGGTFRSIYEDLDDDDNDNEDSKYYNNDAIMLMGKSDEASSDLKLTNNPPAAKTTKEDSTRSDQLDLIERECKLHEHRWRQFLLDVWDEEDRERTPLAITIPPKTALEDSMVIVRSGCISVIHADKPFRISTAANNIADPPGCVRDQNNMALTALDRLSTKLLDIVEKREPDASLLKSAERDIWDIVSRGQIAVDPSSTITKIEDKLRDAATDSTLSLFEQDDCKQDIDALAGVSENQLLRQLLYEPLSSGSVPGLELVAQTTAAFGESSMDVIIDYQLRLIASGLVIRTLYTLRRLFLGRFLILSELFQSHDALNSALKMYLHAGIVLWTAAQIVPIPKFAPNDGLFESFEGDNKNSTPPSKRAIVGGGFSSFLSGANAGKTTVLDARLIHLFKSVGTSQFSRSLSNLPFALARIGLQNGFKLCVISTDQSISHDKLPELSILPLTSKGISNDHARIIIRLVSPFVVLSDAYETAHIIAVREELMAESLLEASHHETSPERAQAMILHAFMLLRFDESDLPNAMHRVETLNRQSTKNPKVAPHFVEFVINAIKQLDSRPPVHPASGMTFDYLTLLWTILFNTALSVRNWDTAYEACINNPNERERMNNSRRLVIAMVDNGDLSKLHDKCAIRSDHISNTLMNPFPKLGDLYGIAVSELTEMSKRDTYTQLAQESEPPSDYNGALFSLLTSKNHWKYAAQALDLRYLNAVECLSKNNFGIDITQEILHRREKLIVDDLVTAAVGCYEAMLNVSNIDDQFLVSGEIQQLPSIPIQIGNRMNSKRGRGDDFRSAQQPVVPTTDVPGNRLDRFMTLNDLETRASRSAVLKVLANDQMCDIQFVKSSFLNTTPNLYSDQVIVGKLFELGYYLEGLRLAKVVSKQIGTKPNGYSPLYYELYHLLTEYLIPMTISNGEAAKLRRPTLSQLYAMRDSLSINEEDTSSVLISERHKKITTLESTETQVVAMNVIYKLVVLYVDAETPIAKDVAESILLNQRVAAPLPVWLEQILLHGTLTEVPVLPGLFALRRKTNDNAPKRYLGDPVVLLNLYVRRGLYGEACRVVCTVLNKGSSEGTKPPARLPEKGDVDFVPYHKIDHLWNLIEERRKKIGENESEEIAELVTARSQMESSLEQHFRMLNINQQGMKSARALSVR